MNLVEADHFWTIGELQILGFWVDLKVILALNEEDTRMPRGIRSFWTIEAELDPGISDGFRGK